jgi:hypothetical protein
MINHQEFLKQVESTKSQAGAIAHGKVPCPVCQRTFPNSSYRCVCHFYAQVFGKIAAIPEKYRSVSLSRMKPSNLSRLSLEEQTKLYAELEARKDSGWAFFAPAGFSKTTCSYALYRHALVSNLKEAYRLGRGVPGETKDKSGNWVPKETFCVWRQSLPDLLAQMKARFTDPLAPAPIITVEKILTAVKEGMRPRVFLDEVDKVRGADEGGTYNTDELFRIFNALDENKGQLVIDTNLSKAQFLDKFGEAIARRVKEDCIMKEYGF